MTTDDASRNNLLQQLCYANPEQARHPLHDEFKDADASVYAGVKPLWDLRIEALKYNDVDPDALVGARLYFAERESFLRHIADAHIYSFEGFPESSDFNQILRVIQYWRLARPLTPPLFFLNSNNCVQKVDGHHRTTVALLSHTPVIPFYCCENLQFSGFREVLPSERELSDLTVLEA